MCWCARIPRMGSGCIIYQHFPAVKEISSVSFDHCAYYVIATVDKDIPEKEVEKIMYERLAEWQAEKDSKEGD